MDNTIFQTSQQSYDFKIWLYNDLMEYNPVLINPFFIKDLSIEESLFDWGIKGYIVVQLNDENLERGSIYQPLTNLVSENSRSMYAFRNDGRNKLSIYIKPLSMPGDPVENFPDFWEMSYDCVIYDIQDLATNNSNTKLKKFYFWDERFQIFNERSIEWSTGLVNAGSNGDSSILTDEQKSIERSEAAYSIIQTASLPTGCFDDSSNATPLLVGFDKAGAINKPNISLAAIDIENWDRGGEHNKVLYTTPVNSNVIDNLEYVLSNFGDQNQMPAFLRFGRTNANKKWQLIGLSKYFDNATPNQIERFSIVDNIDVTPENKHALYLARADTQYNYNSSGVKNFVSGQASIIKDYQFAPMVAIDDLRFCDSHTSRFQFNNNSFFIDNVTVEETKSTIKKAVRGLYSQSKNGDILLDINKTKKDGISVKYMYTPLQIDAQKTSMTSLIRTGLFLNEAVSFTNIGLSMRTPGRFIFIDRPTSQPKKDVFDDRFLGQWFLVNVTHKFIQNVGYYNNITAIKIDSFNKIYSGTDQGQY